MPVILDEEKCTSCKKCQKICPSNTLWLTDRHPVVVDPDRCWHCMACVKICPFNALSLTLPSYISPGKVEMVSWHDGKDVVFVIRENGKEIEKYRFQVICE